MNKNFISKWSFFIVALLFLSACGNEDAPNVTNDELLQTYFAENNLTPQKSQTGLYYIIEEPGSAEKPTADNTVLVHYRGYFLDGEQFDSSFDRGQPAQFPLRGVIPGWTEGLTLFGKEGKGMLFIPSQLAYGNRGQGSIPGNTPLIFDIELLDFQ